MNAVQTWLNDIWVMLQGVLGPTDKDYQAWLLLGGGALVLWIMLRVMAAATSNVNGGIFSNALVLVVGTLIVSLAAVATQRYIVSDSMSPDVARWLPLAAAVIALLALVVPLMCLIQRVKYLTALVSVCVSVAVAAVVITAGHALLQGVSGGEKVGEKIENRMKYQDLEKE